MTGFLICVWCRDCCDDEDGCFDGGTELRGVSGDAEVPFATYADAEEAGHRFVGGAPWEFEVVDAESHKVVTP